MVGMRKGTSRQTVSGNISRAKAAGVERDQAVAMSMDKKRATKKHRATKAAHARKSN
jgi:hypothetical protein